nr:ribokinase [Salsipaludibacter albus]
MGSANLDVVVRTPRHPRPGETVTGHDVARVPGGKGANQAVAAARAGAMVAFLGAVGDDDAGRLLRATLEDAGVDTTGLDVVDAPTGTAHITVDDVGENTIVVVAGANATVELDDHARGAIAAARCLLVQLELALPVVAAAVAHARRHDTLTVLTPAPAVSLPDDLLADVDVLVPNQHEASVLTGSDDPERAADELLGRGVRACVVTLGGDGALAARADARTRHPAPRVPVLDTTGAGDAFVGSLAVALVEGRSLGDAVDVATAAASLSVQRAGAIPSLPTRAQIDEVTG